jgi:hypothetical protein
MTGWRNPASITQGPGEMRSLTRSDAAKAMLHMSRANIMNTPPG